MAVLNANNRTITPSVVYLGNEGPIVGEEAKDRQAAGATDVASFFKRHMGDTNFELFVGGISYTPTDLSTLVLKHLKAIAEAHLRQPVTQAVITVPAYFNNMQREATILAGRQAGLEILSIISEPTSAALAYGMRPTQDSQKILVYDLGGGTFDVSVVQISQREQRVLGTGGDHNLGGKDWDDRILVYLSQQFEDEFGVELVGTEFNDLLVKAENAKKSLTTRAAVRVAVQAGGNRAAYDLTRTQFEKLTADLMIRTQHLTEQVLEDIKLRWSDLANVLLVGGSTRMPMVRTWVENMSGRPPLTTIDPDEAVALGAAIQAATEIEERTARPVLPSAVRKKSVDVISHSLGMIATNGDRSRYLNSIIIQKNQPIPTQHTRPFKIRLGRRGDNQLDVYMTQGESDAPSDCAYLGKYVFSNIPNLTNREAVIDITYAYDKNGVVQVSAVERSSGQPLRLTIEPLPADVPARFALPPEQETPREHLTVYLAFDLSGSMSGAPLDEAKKAARRFVSGCDLSSTSVGLIAFSDSVRVEIKACQNAKTINSAIDRLEIGRTGVGNDAHPFEEISISMRRVAGLRYAIVLTDGVWNDQPLAVKRAKKCHSEGIEVIAVGIAGADVKFLSDISSSDENNFFTNLNDLANTFSTIAQEITENSGSSAMRRLKP